MKLKISQKEGQLNFGVFWQYPKGQQITQWYRYLKDARAHYALLKSKKLDPVLLTKTKSEKEVKKQVNKKKDKKGVRGLMLDPSGRNLGQQVNSNKRNKDLWKSKQNMGWNIYNANITMGAHLKKFHVLHFILKSKILVPVLKLLDKFLYKYLDNDSDDQPCNRGLNAFNKSFEDAIWDWCYCYFGEKKKGVSIKDVMKDRYDPTNATMKRKKKHSSPKFLRIIKKLGLTICKNDTAYREFLNILMFHITMNMNKAYKDEKVVDHVFYKNGSISDVRYYFIANDVMINKPKKEQLKKAGGLKPLTKVSREEFDKQDDYIVGSEKDPNVEAKKDENKKSRKD